MKTLKEIIADWKDEAGIKPWEETVAVHKNGDKLFIITKSPGHFIGYHGNLVEKYKKILHENGHDIEIISFVDLFVGNVREF